MTIRIAMWSGPRNISTAMLRSWGSRADTRVVDEPFYAAYLATTGLPHPMRDEVLASQPRDWQQVADACATADSAPIVFQKHMSQHMLPDAPLGWMSACRHAFLIRDPAAVAASFARGWPGMSAGDLGFHRQVDLFDHVRALTGATPPVLDAEDVLAAPEPMLRALTAALGVPFDPAMLAWAPGPRATDGVWAAHWYQAVERSTGFAPPSPAAPVPPDLAPIVEACRAPYERLRAARLAPV